MTENQPQEEQKTESVGARLRQARLDKGISLDEAHEKTKIHLNILKAIEEDSLSNVSPVYSKGFLKIYCRFLGLNPGEFIQDYQEPKAIPPYSPSAAKGEPLLRAGALFSGLMLWLRRVKIKQVLVVAACFMALVFLFKLGKFVATRRKAPAPMAASAKEKLPQKGSSVKRDKASSVAPAAEGAASAAAPKVAVKAPEEKPPATAAAILRLTIRAKEDCYIQLKTDGHTVFQGVIKKNRFDSWEAKEKIEFSLSNAGGVELEVNGKTITNIGRRKQALKQVLITKEGLSILN